MKFGFGKVWSILASLWEGAAKRMITSFIIQYLGWLANIRVFVPDSDYPLTGLLPRNAPIGISRP